MAHIGELLLEMGIMFILALPVSHQKLDARLHRRQKVVVLLQELCFLPTSTNVNDIEAKIVDQFPSNYEIIFLNKPDTCNDSFLILPALVKEIEDQRTVAVVGTTEPFLCALISRLVDANGKLFIAWNCPEDDAASRNPPRSYTVQMLPAIRDVVGAVFSLFKHFRWKRAAIVSVENGAWWTHMGSELEYVLNNENVSLSNNAFIILPTTSTELLIKRQLQQLMAVLKPRATTKTHLDGALILCVPEYSTMFWKILRVLGDLQISVPVLIMRLSSSLYFYQHPYQRNSTADNGLFYNPMTKKVETNFSDSDYNNTFKRYDKTDILNALVNNSATNSRPDVTNNQTDAAADTNGTEQFDEFKSNVLASPFSHYRYSAQNFTGTLESLKHSLLLLSPHYTYHLSEQSFLELIKITNNLIQNKTHRYSVKNQIPDKFSTSDCFLLSDIADKSIRQILYLRKTESCDNCTNNKENFQLTPLISDSANWFNQKMLMKYSVNQDRLEKCNEMGCDEGNIEGGFLDDLSLDAMLLILFIVIVVVVFTSCLTMLARKQYVTRRRMKDPCKILLTSEDIIFPQITEPRRVEEGIEAMLCCWLQQLHEFGGPEVDKPDLLKGPDDSVKSFPLKHVNSSNSVTKPIASNEIRARYNGDLVQLKDIPVYGGSFELRSKSLNVLMMIHGLRHENLNPFIGLLVDPVRPALVWEYCSRGSLEDVLIQDEIKLDWSFRLSLLTDLVRGMKYLHSSPYRVHGTLSSRNCVIDARWVLKITDYCLTEFNEAQNITTINKTARDLLWTAPELLRNESLMRKGTQQGDVYSFAIIMQEVVVRGEPFCMLSLSPEDIIEKLKKPPPLIRPSVSKGAAPPEAINIMRQCWAEQADKRPDFNAIYDLFKTLNHGRKINFVDTMFQMLEKYSNNLEDLIRERTEQLDMEKKKTEQLLNRMLPYSVAEKLKLGMPVDPEEFSEVTIYFSDIVGFTTISAYSTPFEVVDLLNDLYTCFDATINAYNVYKVETIGDAYMVVGGLPVRITDHADQIATMALDLLHQSGQFKISHLPLTPLRLRIGLHTGPCCAGVVGLTMPRYCLFGDTVNTASRLESTGSPGRIHISEATKLKLDMVGKYRLEYRGETELKGKGKMPTYWLLGKEGFEKDVPTPPPVTENHGLDEELIRTSREHRFQRLSVCGKLPSESSVELDQPVTNSKQLVVQKSLDSGLFTDSGSSFGHKSWTNRRQMTFDSSDRNDYYRHTFSFEQKMKHIPESNGKLVNSGTTSPFSSSDKNIDLVGVPFVNKNTNSNTGSKRTKHVVAKENDLSTPYNYYRCLPPNENPSSTKFVSKFLKRQFSVDKSDDSAIVLQEVPITKTSKLFKQNSAGHDGDKTEKAQVYRFNNNILPSMSISTESLT